MDLSVVKVWYQSGRGIYIEKEKHYLVPELLLKDDGLVRLDTEQQVNFLKMPMNEMRDADELQAFDIPAGEVKQIWVTVQVPVDVATGEYSGTIQVTVGDEGDDFDRGYGPWREQNMTYPTVNGLISTLQWATAFNVVSSIL